MSKPLKLTLTKVTCRDWLNDAWGERHRGTLLNRPWPSASLRQLGNANT